MVLETQKHQPISTLFCFWLFQLPFAYIEAIVLDAGPIGVFLSITFAEILIAIIGIWLFKKGKWKTVQV